MRQRKGIYEPEKLAAIKAMKSSEIFMKITDVKCRHAKNWIKDILFQPGTTPWDIEPTPEPEVPPWIEERVKTRVLQLRMGNILQEAAATGTAIPAEIIPSILQQEMPAVLDEIKKEMAAEAKEIAEKMKVKIDDQLTEGNFYEALGDCIDDVILHTGFIKGPTYRRVKVRKLVSDPATGRKQAVLQDEIQAQYEKVSPLDIYPAPDSNDINDGYLIEKSSLTGVQLSSLKGVPTFSDEAVAARPPAVRQRRPQGVDRDRERARDPGKQGLLGHPRLDQDGLPGFLGGHPGLHAARVGDEREGGPGPGPVLLGLRLAHRQPRHQGHAQPRPGGGQTLLQGFFRREPTGDFGVEACPR